MSSSSDQYVFQDSIEDKPDVNLFEDKKYTYITDSSSNNGQFNGQIQFDLNTLSSQSSWVDLKEAVIEFPVKLTINNQNGTTSVNQTNPGANFATIKNSFHQFVDSLQIVLNGTTVQTSQIFTNIDTTFKMLTEWSNETLNKHGSQLGVALDDSVFGSTDLLTSENEANNTIAATAAGIDMTNQRNSGFKERIRLTNQSTAAGGALANLVPSMNQTGQNNTALDKTATNSDIWVAYAVGTVRLKDLSDCINNMPLIKNLSGYIYLNYNAAVSTINATSAGVLSAPTNTALFGRCMPGMFNIASTSYTTSGTSTNSAVYDGCQLGDGTNAAKVTFTAEISGVKSSNSSLSSANPVLTNARLVTPYYQATPTVDRTLKMEKVVRYNERFVTSFNLNQLSSANLTLSPGLSNPKRVILYPFYTGTGASGYSNFLSNPLLSPFDSVPATSSTFATLKDLQFYVSNKPMFQSPVNYGFEHFMQEVSRTGLDGGQNDEQSSGLINFRQWNTFYRYYTCDLGRRLDSEDGASKSIQVSCTNATNCPMTVIAIIWYEKQVKISTDGGVITNA